MGADVLELHVDDARRSSPAAAAARLGSGEARSISATAASRCRPPGRGRPDERRAAPRRGRHRAERPQPAPSSLDDVFLALTGRGASRGGGGRPRRSPGAAGREGARERAIERPSRPPQAPPLARLPASAIFTDSFGSPAQLLTIIRTPQLLVFSTIQPVMFVLLFRYVFGGAITCRPTATRATCCPASSCRRSPSAAPPPPRPGRRPEGRASSTASVAADGALRRARRTHRGRPYAQPLRGRADDPGGFAGTSASRADCSWPWRDAHRTALRLRALLVLRIRRDAGERPGDCALALHPSLPVRFPLHLRPARDHALLAAGLRRPPAGLEAVANAVRGLSLGTATTSDVVLGADLDRRRCCSSSCRSPRGNTARAEQSRLAIVILGYDRAA